GISRAKETATTLRQVFEQKAIDTTTRSSILVALGLLDDQASGDPIVGLASSESDPDLRAAAALSAGLMNYGPAKAPFPKIAAHDPASFLRPAFGLALALLGDWESLDQVQGLAIDPGSSTTTRIQAIQALAYMRDLGSIDVLVHVLQPSLKTTDLVRANAI